MSSTYFSLHYHLVFSTKGRKPTIDIKWRERLHEILLGILSARCPATENLAAAGLNIEKVREGARGLPLETMKAVRT